MRNMQHAAILVVDDEPDLCDMLGFEFEMQGSAVFYAYDGDAAFEILKQKKIDAVITDIRMPRANGVELLDRIRLRDDARPAVVFITAYDNALSVREAFDRGAEGFFAKPFRLKELVERVESLLESPNERYSIPSDHPCHHQITRRFPDLQTASESQEFALGRGGFAISMDAIEATPGETVAFDIKFDSGPVSELIGNGSISWTAQNAASRINIAGIEFSFLNETSRNDLTRYIHDHSCRAFIPRL